MRMSQHRTLSGNEAARSACTAKLGPGGRKMRMTDETKTKRVLPFDRKLDTLGRTGSLARPYMAVRLLVGLALFGLPIFAQRAVVEGYALDTNGKPMPG